MIHKQLHRAGGNDVEAVTGCTLSDDLLTGARGLGPQASGQILDRSEVECVKQWHPMQEPDQPSTTLGAFVRGADPP